MSEAESFPYPVAIGYLIDTNIWSYAMQERAATVRAMESGEIAGKLLVSVVTIGEILCGINAMPGGNRRRELEARQEAAMKRWNPRIIAVGQREAIEYAMIFAELRRLGRPVPVNDLWIAATARAGRMVLVTADAHFESVSGLDLKDWR